MSFQPQTLRLPSDVFALAVHPTKPLLAIGLSSGHVYSYTWPYTEPAADESESENSDSDSDSDTESTPKPSNPSEPPPLTLSWKTKRHKGSCRNIAYSTDGSTLFSAGLDSILKAADSETGKIKSKAALPQSKTAPDSVTALLPLSPEHLLVGTDLGHVYLYSLKNNGFTAATPSGSWKNAHDDYISALLPLPASSTTTSGYARQFLALGDTTLSHLDARKPGNVLAKSDDQEDELLSAAYISSAPSRQTGGSQKIITGTAAGVVTAWNKGFWEDHQDRIPVSRSTGDAVDALLPLPGDFVVPGVKAGKPSWKQGISASGAHQTLFAAGSADGKVRIVKMGMNKILATLDHSYSKDEAKRAANAKVKRGDYDEGLEEGVALLALTCDGRIVSAGGLVVKVWNAVEENEEDTSGKKRRQDDSDEDSDKDSDSDSDSDSEDEKEKKKRKKKKRKGGIGKARSIGVKNVASFAGLD
ncbi:WD40 repeat-like protein [Ascodesmis nigricans]|uniref:WD repeat-containing protein JIP5 n=1 Tax=Ascodesmis nigricans TaxID=341454 RepID=A0A4S2N152_9PEZI|nr:WD40 repeat-like protein [Ascodesmis nigricans]